MKAYHLKLSKKDLKGVKTVLLPGDPERVEKIALLSGEKNFRIISENREFKSAVCNVSGVSVLITSTGIGCPAVSIVVEELANLGIKNFIRVGTSGAIQPGIEPGDLIISTAAVRLDGTSRHYAPLSYPAVASFDIVSNLVSSAEKMKVKFHTGITATSDTFYPGQERYDTYSGHVIRDFRGSLEELKKLKVLNFEMESSALFVITQVFGLKSGTICGVIVNRLNSEKPDDSLIQRVEVQSGRVALDAAMNLK